MENKINIITREKAVKITDEYKDIIINKKRNRLHAVIENNILYTSKQITQAANEGNEEVFTSFCFDRLFCNFYESDYPFIITEVANTFKENGFIVEINISKRYLKINW